MCIGVGQICGVILDDTSIRLYAHIFIVNEGQETWLYIRRLQDREAAIPAKTIGAWTQIISILDLLALVTIADPKMSKIVAKCHAVVVDTRGTAVLSTHPNVLVASPQNGGKPFSDSNVVVVDTRGTAVPSTHCLM